MASDTKPIGTAVEDFRNRHPLIEHEIPQREQFLAVEEFKGSPITIRFKELVKHGFIKTFILDGTDGSGKETITDKLADTLVQTNKARVIKIQYPNYTTLWGRAITSSLNNPDLHFRGKEARYALYALNRMETLLDIMYLACNQFPQDMHPFIFPAGSITPSVLVFDRSAYSNVITLAYDLVASAEDNQTAEEIVDNMTTEQFEAELRLMANYDSLFLEMLPPEESIGYIPDVDPTTSQRELRDRDSQDIYERDLRIQQVSYLLYKEISRKAQEQSDEGSKAIFNTQMLDRSGSPEDVVERIISQHFPDLSNTYEFDLSACRIDYDPRISINPELGWKLEDDYPLVNDGILEAQTIIQSILFDKHPILKEIYLDYLQTAES
jgi:thymidylate kinase